MDNDFELVVLTDTELLFVLVAEFDKLALKLELGVKEVDPDDVVDRDGDIVSLPVALHVNDVVPLKVLEDEIVPNGERDTENVPLVVLLNGLTLDERELEDEGEDE